MSSPSDRHPEDGPEDRPARSREQRPAGRSDDAFARGQADSEALRRAVDDVRADVEALVRREVERVGMSPSDVEKLVREAVAAERRRPSGAEGVGAGAPPWLVPALAGAALTATVLFFGALGWRTLGPGPTADPSEGAAATVAAPGGQTTGGEAASPAGEAAAANGAPGSGVADAAPTPAETAALYDSLFAAGSERLAPLVDRLDAAGPAAPVAAAVTTWRAGEPLDADAARRLHDALVQLALNEEAGAGLTLDGLLTRGPCGGNSCGALLELWRSRGDDLGMPELPADPAGDTGTLAVAERVLIMGRLDDGSSP